MASPRPPAPQPVPTARCCRSPVTTAPRRVRTRQTRTLGRATRPTTPRSPIPSSGSKPRAPPHAPSDSSLLVRRQAASSAPPQLPSLLRFLVLRLRVRRFQCLRCLYHLGAAKAAQGTPQKDRGDGDGDSEQRNPGEDLDGRRRAVLTVARLMMLAAVARLVHWRRSIESSGPPRGRDRKMANVRWFCPSRGGDGARRAQKLAVPLGRRRR